MFDFHAMLKILSIWFCAVVYTDARILRLQRCIDSLWPQELKEYVACSGNIVNNISYVNQDHCQMISLNKQAQCIPLLFSLENYNMNDLQKTDECTEQEFVQQSTSIQQSSTTYKNELYIIKSLHHMCESKIPGSTTKLLDEPFKSKIMGITNNAADSKGSFLSILFLYVIICFVII